MADLKRQAISTMNMLRCIALLTVAGGVLLLARVAVAVSAEFADGFRQPLPTMAILASALSIALTIIWVAIQYLKQRSRTSAVRLAVAASAVVCFIWPATTVHVGGGVVTGLLFYFLVARPAVIGAFREDRRDAGL